jgi:hypothetical protein
MKAEFVQPRFVGPRFEDSTLPVEVARDLVAYENLVKELAKHLYLRDHEERERVPKGFAADIQLHLVKVDEGSAKPLLAMVGAGLLALDAGTSDYLTKARDLVAECIRADDGQLPAEFPRSLLSYFNKIGRSLRDGEQMELTTKHGGNAVLTPERCKHLVLAANKQYEREIEVCGTIEEANWAKSTFQLRLLDGRQLVIPMPESFHAQAGRYGGHPRHLVVVQGVGAFNSSDRLEKMISVDSLEIQQDYQLAAKLDELAALSDGWYDKKGKAPAKVKLTWLASHLLGHYPESLALPAIVPTPEGNILLEWDAEGDPSVDLDLDTLTASYHAFGMNGGELEQEFDLNNEAAWAGFYEFLQANIESRLA